MRKVWDAELSQARYIRCQRLDSTTVRCCVELCFNSDNSVSLCVCAGERVCETGTGGHVCGGADPHSRRKLEIWKEQCESGICIPHTHIPLWQVKDKSNTWGICYSIFMKPHDKTYVTGSFSHNEYFHFHYYSFTIAYIPNQLFCACHVFRFCFLFFFSGYGGLCLHSGDSLPRKDFHSQGTADLCVFIH